MSDILHLLHHRRSSKKFGDLAPNAEQLNNILKAALRAPDHGRMKPYHFVVIEKSGMGQLHQYLSAAVAEFGLDEHAQQKAAKLCKQAPMVIGVVAKIDHNSPKVPAWEQMVTAGCATYAMQLAANAQGFDTVWISKRWVDGAALRQAFGCEEGDKVIGLIMIGSPPEVHDEPKKSARSENPEDYVSVIR
ncbi:nitroreductase [Pasteurellaceae bacterium RH1A]|nr:nitroreductase [Pasteurellaceae bacterium RH1A]